MLSECCRDAVDRQWTSDFPQPKDNLPASLITADDVGIRAHAFAGNLSLGPEPGPVATYGHDWPPVATGPRGGTAEALRSSAEYVDALLCELIEHVLQSAERQGPVLIDQ
ncbi:hypothetical protein GCM10009579_44600 [Streptomyces javensis]|uniref:Uncharacterized protein n=1 Tax=Streptomyces javensis TaxID=114698 RepID=A0ABN1X252_9ACTN